MLPTSRTISRARARSVAIVFAALFVAGCASNDQAVSSNEIFDPNEDSNRQMHEFNRKVDRVIFRPVSNGYGTAVPEEARTMVSNFADNLSLPADIVNNLLQGDLRGAGNNTFRFLFNSTIGLGGIADPASNLNVPRRETDFGETFHVWGMKEGAYVELPLLGPSTERDAIGTILDFTLDPVSALLPAPESYAGTAANIADRMGDRYELRGTIDSILYESADSYAQARILYLQNRRFELGGDNADTYLDPYDDPYAELE